MAKSTHTRKLTNDHVTVGGNRNSLGKNSAVRVVSTLTVGPVENHYGDTLTEIVAVDRGGKVNAIRLADAGRREVVKGLLMHLLDTPICIAADEELRSILDQCRKAVEFQDEDARQVVAAITERHSNVRIAPPERRPCPGCGADLNQSQNHETTCPYRENDDV